MKSTQLICSILLLLFALPTGAIAQEVNAQNPDQVQLQLVDSDIRDALRMVAKQGGINLVLSNGVQGNITLELDGVSIQETLDAIVSVGGYQYTRNGNIVTVTTLTELLERDKLREEFTVGSTLDQEAMVIELRYVSADRVLSVIEGMLSKEGSVAILKSADQAAQDYSNGGSMNGSSNPNPSSTGAASQAGGLKIGSQLSSTSQGLPAQSHTLVAVDTPDRLERIRKVVDHIDVKPPQVLIEARFVEVALDKTDKLGIDWNLVARATGGSAPTTLPFGGASLGSYGPNVKGGGVGGIFPSAPNSVTTPTTAGLFTFGALDFTALSAVLELIQTDSRVKIVSNPRIVVGDRHTATILVGERYPILSANISEFGTVTEELDRYEPIGVQLEVTPAVLGDDEIELMVRPSTSSLGGEITGSTGLTVARINSRQIDTSVTAMDNQTIVLGGLYTTREVKESSRVPVLGSIPLLGGLFEHEANTVEKVELVIFLTVTIVREGGLTESQKSMFDDSSDDHGSALDPDRTRSQLEYSSTGPKQ
jgi:type IV pilus assembly protein PilQ